MRSIDQTMRFRARLVHRTGVRCTRGAVRRALREYALDSANGSPVDLWSDGVTLWVSDPGSSPRRLFAYRLPTREALQAAEGATLERLRDEDFTHLSSASNNSPRGIWAEGDLMYVADASDGKIYTYNMPDAIDARLASLALEGVDIGTFDPDRADYEGVVAEDVTATTVAAEAMQRRTNVAIDPPDADAVAPGHQLTLTGLAAITITVTSADGLRTKVYRVRLGEPEPEPWPHCLRGDIAVGFSLAVYEGGSIEELGTCAASYAVVALYALHENAYVPFIPGAPDFFNLPFRELYPTGVPAFTPLVVAARSRPVRIRQGRRRGRMAPTASTTARWAPAPASASSCSRAAACRTWRSVHGAWASTPSTLSSTERGSPTSPAPPTSSTRPSLSASPRASPWPRPCSPAASDRSVDPMGRNTAYFMQRNPPVPPSLESRAVVYGARLPPSRTLDEGSLRSALPGFPPPQRLSERTRPGAFPCVGDL